MSAALCGPNAVEYCYTLTQDLLCEGSTSPLLGPALGKAFLDAQQFCSFTCLKSEAYMPLPDGNQKCCYAAAQVACEGRPFFVDGVARHARVRRGRAWCGLARRSSLLHRAERGAPAGAHERERSAGGVVY